MEDYQEQEYEFLRRLEEERVGRKTLLKRGVVAGAGLTVLSLSPSALAARKKVLATPPTRGTLGNLREMVQEAKKEGHLNVIALPPDWANYGEIISTFSKKYGIPITSDNPDGSSAQENQAIVSLKGDPRAPDVVDVNPTFAVAGAAQGLYAKYYPRNYATIPRAMKDTRGFWMGDYWGSVTIGYNANLVKNPPKSFADLLKPEYKNQVALNGSPLTSGSAIAGVFAAALANGGSLSNVAPGIDWFAKCKSVGNFIPVQTVPQTVASGQTPISIDWDYNNFAYVKEFPVGELEGDDPVRRQVRRLLRAGGQRRRTASVCGPAVAGVHLLRPGADPLSQGVRTSGAVRQPAQAEGDPEVGHGRVPGGLVQRHGEVREPRPAGGRESGHQHAVAGQGRLELIHWPRTS